MNDLGVQTDSGPRPVARGLDGDTDLVYRAMLEHPAWTMAELAGGLGRSEGEVRDALARLAELSLTQHDPGSPAHWRTVNPVVGLTTVLARQEAELARQLQQLEASRTLLAGILARQGGSWGATASPELERLDGLVEIRLRLEQLAKRARRTVLAFAPGGPQAAEVLDSSRPLDEDTLARGVAMRTLFQDSVRNDAASAAYSRWLTAHGGEVRTAAALPLRMVVADGEVAVLPTDPADPSRGAVVITSRGVIAALEALFELVWQTAVPLGNSQQRNEEGMTAQEREVLRSLAAGLTDEAVARRIGVSLRTVRRITSELAARADARSRFQLGVLATERGWLQPDGKA